MDSHPEPPWAGMPSGIGQPADRPSSTDSLEPASPQRALVAEAFPLPGSPPTGRRTWTYLRWGFWLVLLAGVAALWTLSRLHPEFADGLARWIAQWQQSSVSQSQRDAEQAAAQALRKAGALVIDEGPQQGITSVHFITPGSLSDESLSQLEWLVRLNSLNFIGMPITDRQLSYVAKARTLASLVLNDTPIGDAGLRHLASLEQLEVLHLRKTAVSDAGLAYLAPLRNLKVLDLSETQVTDEGLPQLAQLAELRWLLLDGTAVTDAGLKHLEALPRLSQLNLRSTRVSPEGIARLKKALPQLYVDHR